MPSWGQEYAAWAVVFWVIVGILVVVGGIALIQGRRGTPTVAERRAEEDLNRRFARGEIDAKELRRQRRELRRERRGRRTLHHQT